MQELIKRALLIGIDDYHWSPLSGCVADAKAMEAALAQHDNGEPNFACTLLTSDETKVTEARMRKAVREFFSEPGDVGLVYFSGHGGKDDLKGYLTTTDAEKFSLGFPLAELLERAQAATSYQEIFIVLDCCYSGGVTDNINESKDLRSILPRKGISILTSSLSDQYSIEKHGRGVFTKILEDGLLGNAADLLGNVTAAGLYHYADRMLNPKMPRPLFISHVSGFRLLRECAPKLKRDLLRKIPSYFPEPDHKYPLDSRYEPTEYPRDAECEAIFKELQELTRAGLVEPVGAEHMYYAAINEKACQLTNGGKAYWSIVKEGWF